MNKFEKYFYGLFAGGRMSSKTSYCIKFTKVIQATFADIPVEVMH